MSNLYKVDSKGHVRVLTIMPTGDKVVRYSGVLGGQLVQTSKVCTPKNVGKSNETTPEHQAILEAESEINEKIREGYVFIDHDKFSTIPRNELRQYILDNTSLIPDAMLAETYKHSWCKWDELMLASPKLDGQRCMAVITKDDVKLYSRGRLEITTMDHIKDELKLLRDITNFEGILDGELYYHDRDADNFQDIMKACKKYRPGISEKVEYHVYELINEDLSAIDRYNLLYHILSDYPYPVLTLVPQVPCTTYSDLLHIHGINIQSGYEGTMLKHGSGMYRQGARSQQLLKFKDFKDAEFEIVDIIPMANYPNQGMAVCKAANGLEFRATPKMSHTDRELLLLNKQNYIGRMATIKYFSETEAGLPRIGVLKDIK